MFSGLMSLGEEKKVGRRKFEKKTFLPMNNLFRVKIRQGVAKLINVLKKVVELNVRRGEENSLRPLRFRAGFSPSAFADRVRRQARIRAGGKSVDHRGKIRRVEECSDVWKRGGQRVQNRRDKRVRSFYFNRL